MRIKFQLVQSPVTETAADCIIVGVYGDGTLSPAAAAVDAAAEGALQRRVKAGDLKGKKGTTLWLYDLAGVASPRVLAIGLGEAEGLDATRFAAAADAAAKALASAPIEAAASFLGEIEVAGKDAAWKLRTLALAADHAAYRFKIGKKDASEKRLTTLALAGPAEAAQALEHAGAIADGIRWTRDLANTPPNICTPAWLASEAERIAAEHEQVEAEVFGPEALREMGANALLAVGAGSENTPRLIVLRYTGAGDAKPFAFVGKGVTFDTGGINIKPSAGLEEMKFDMGGAAGVMGAFLAAVRMRLPINLVCVVASAENMPGGRSYRPSDILTTMAGITVEVLNTDAEGRLCLCDALHYVRRYEPQAIIDAATLTGACVIALGAHASGLMTADEELARELLAAGESSLDRAWRLPLWDDYQQQLESVNAEVANLGGRPGGAITAACFLSRFTKGMRWAHLDIAGTAWVSGRKGQATGRPVALLADWLLAQAG